MGKSTAAPEGAAPPEGDSAFARALASSDYHARAKGLKALEIWLHKKDKLQLEEVLKIWRGVLFCFWHSDKAHVQKDLAAQLANIMRTLPFKVALVYFEGFLVTLAREWPSIDKLRLDKFMMLVREFIRTAFTLLQEHKWDAELTEQISHKIETRSFIVDDAAKPIGFGLHLADLYISELQTCCQKEDAEKLPHAAALSLLQPFIITLQRSAQPTLIARIKVRVLEEFASLLEDGSGEHQPFSLVDRESLGQALFACGALEVVKRRNRHALYELAALFDRKRKSKKRSMGSAEALQVTPAAVQAAEASHKPVSAGSASTHVAAPASGAGADAPGSGTCSASQDGSSREQPKKKQKKQNGTAKPLKKKLQAENIEVQEQPIVQSQREMSSSPKMASEASTKKNGIKADRAVPGKQKNGACKPAAAVQVSAETSVAASDLSPAPAAASTARKEKRKRKRKSKQGAENGGTNTCNGGARLNGQHSGSQRNDKTGLTVAESKMLGNAVDAAVGRCPQKRISFNLSKNLVHQIGKPLPPPEMRTPPSAKPTGSALKRVSSVGVKKSSSVVRKLVF